MADEIKVKMSEFAQATQVNNADDIIILQNGENKKVKSPVLESKIINRTVEELSKDGGVSLNLVNLKGVVATYANLPNTNLQINDAYQVATDGLVYTWNGTAFQSNGQGFKIQPNVNGVVEQGNTNAVSGGAVANYIKNVDNKYNSLVNSKSNWVDNLMGNNTGINVPELNLLLKSIKDVWFEFPNGKPEWWNSRVPQLRILSGGLYSFTKIGFIFRTDNTDTAPIHRVDYNWAMSGDIDSIRFPVKIDSDITFYINALIDTSYIYNLNTIIFNNDMALAIQPVIIEKYKTNYKIADVLFKRKSTTLLIDGGRYITYNSITQELNIPETARVMFNNGIIINCVPGTYNAIGNAFFIFMDNSNGNIITVNYVNMSSNLIYTNEEKYTFIGFIHRSLKIADFITKKYKIDGVIMSEVELSNYIPKNINNIPLPIKKSDEPLNVLLFGSSFFRCTWWYLPYIIQDLGLNINLTCFYSAGANFNSWVTSYNNGTNRSCFKSVNGSPFVETTESFKSNLDLGNFDIIGFQQGVFQSVNYDSNYLKIIEIIRKTNNLASIFYNGVYTPPIQGNLSPYASTLVGQKAYQNDTYIAEGRIFNESGLNINVPNGSLMRRLRNSNMNTSNDFCTDDLHPDNGLPQYALGINLFANIFSRCYNIDIKNISFIPTSDLPRNNVSSTNFIPITETDRNNIISLCKVASSNYNYNS